MAFLGVMRCRLARCISRTQIANARRRVRGSGIFIARGG